MTSTLAAVPSDHAAREAATDIRRSCIVSAPAGSGKTGLLTLRVLKLLAAVQRPEEILCITFTRKAAHEMRERIFGALQRAADQPDMQCDDPYQQTMHTAALAALQHAEALEWHLLDAPYRLNISTIDGLCKSLSAQLAFFSGAGSAAGIIEEPGQAYLRVVRDWLNTALQSDESAQLAALISHLDGNLERLVELLARLLGMRDQWLPLVVQSGIEDAAIRAYFEDTIKAWIIDSVRDAEATLGTWALELLPLLHLPAEHSAGTKVEKALRLLSQMPHWPDAEHDSAPAFWRALSAFCLTDKGEIRKRLDTRLGFPAEKSLPKELKGPMKACKQRIMALFTELAQNKEAVEVLKDLAFLPKPHYEETQWQVLSALTQLLPELAARLKLSFQTLGQADFTEYSLSAVSALQRETGDVDLQQRLDYRIQHILVDEFQDTSQMQLELLQALTQEWLPDEGRTLFLVGDGMQSCYGFRNANVGIFLNCRAHGIGHVALDALDLTVNFRSTDTVVSWVNHAFSSSFPSRNEANLGAVAYIPSQAFKPASDASWVKLWAVSSQEDAPEQVEAQHIAEEIAQLRTRFHGESVAVLARSRAQLSATIQALKLRQIPFQALDIDALASRPFIMDLCSLTRLLYSPEDQLAWLSLLRMPCFAFTHEALYEVLGPESDKLNTLPLSRLHSSLTALDPALQKRARYALPIVESAIQNRQRRPLSESVHTLWLKLGLAATLSGEADRADVQRFFRLLASHEVAHSIEDWEKFTAAIEKLYATPPSSGDTPVQIMTMHKSKGLEFDSVFLPALSRGKRAQDSEVLYWLERLDDSQDRHFVLSPISAKKDAQMDALTQFIRKQKDKKSLYEDNRVFYVACTRAKKRLYLSAALKPGNDEGSWSAPPATSFLGQIYDSISASILPAPHSIDVAHQASDSEESRSGAIKALDPASIPPLPALLKQDTPTPDNSEYALLEDWLQRQPLARARGTAMHRILQLLGEHPKQWAQLAQPCPPTWTLLLQSMNLARHTASALAKEIHTVLKQLQDDSTFKWLMHAHEESQFEWRLPISDANSEVLIADRSFIDGDTRWIIDFKSSAPSPDQDVEQFVHAECEQYRTQLARYARRVAKFDQGKTASRLRCALYFPFLARLETLEDLTIAY